MNDPAVVHSIAVQHGFADILHWAHDGNTPRASVTVCGLTGLAAEESRVDGFADVMRLRQCLDECEGHGLLWREDACLLYAARRWCVKPQPYAYSESPEINELFDAIGAA